MKNWSSILEFYEHGHKSQKWRQYEHSDARTHDVDRSFENRRPRRPDWRNWKVDGLLGRACASNG
jgi:hypothetical protein